MEHYVNPENLENLITFIGVITVASMFATTLSIFYGKELGLRICFGLLALGVGALALTVGSSLCHELYSRNGLTAGYAFLGVGGMVFGSAGLASGLNCMPQMKGKKDLK